MWHDEADEAQQTGNADSAGSQQGGDGRQAQAGAFDRQAQAAGHIIAELEQVEIIGADS